MGLLATMVSLVGCRVEFGLWVPFGHRLNRMWDWFLDNPIMGKTGRDFGRFQDWGYGVGLRATDLGKRCSLVAYYRRWAAQFWIWVPWQVEGLQVWGYKVGAGRIGRRSGFGRFGAGSGRRIVGFG